MDGSVRGYAFGDDLKQCLLTFDFVHAFYSHHKTLPFTSSVPKTYVFHAEDVRFPYQKRTSSIRKT